MRVYVCVCGCGLDIIKTEASAQVRYAKGTENLYIYDGKRILQHKNMPMHTMICVQQECTHGSVHTHTHTHNQMHTMKNS